MRIVNERAYKPTSASKIVEMKVLVMLDPVPGAWHQPEDIMNWIAQHSYVQSVELVSKATGARMPLSTANERTER